MISNVFVYYNNSGHRHHNQHQQHNHRYLPNKTINTTSHRTNFNCSCDGPQYPRRRGDSLGHFTSTSFNTIFSNTQLLETHDEAKPNLSSSAQKHGSILEVPIVISNPTTTTTMAKPPIANNTQPIQIANNNKSINNKSLSVSLNMKNSPGRIGMTGGSVNNNNNINMNTTSSPGGLKIDLTHQSSSSSLISSNSSSNLNQNPDSETNKENNTSFNSPCSSVPTYYGSYSGIYKRLMRSLSNSLISSTGTAVPGNMSQNVNDSVNSGSVNLDNMNGEYSSSFKNSGVALEKQRAVSGKSNSFSFKEPDTVGQPWICEKCIDNNRYPKYKVGMAVLFCLPKARKSSNSTNSTPSSSPLSTSCSPPSVFHEPTTTGLSKPTTTTTTNNNKKSKLQKQQSYDPIVMFPSSPPEPSSPHQNNHNQQNTLNGQLKSLALQSQLESEHAINANNDNFYEFFFSHLPIIEHQIKEFKEKLFDTLPVYFQQQQKTHLNRASFSFATSPSQQHHGNHLTAKCANCIRKMKLSPHLSQKLMLATNSFTQKILMDLDEYERRFNLLYSSPRLSMPAWLTITNERKLTNDVINKRTNVNQIATFNLCNSLIAEIVDFEKIKKQSGDKPQIMGHNNLSNGHRFILKVDKLRSLLSSQNNLQATESNTTITQQINNKSSATSPFLHIVLSTVLKHHLSWVYTILPANELSSTKSLSFTASLRKQRAKWTSILEKTNPYNPLWAQLSDLHGAVNHPLRLVRTVVVGKNQDLVERLLQLLSYFIRCSNSSCYDIKAEHFDFERLLSQQANSGQQSSSFSSLPSASPRTSHRNTNKATSTSTITNQDQAELMSLPKYQSSFDETDDNNHQQGMSIAEVDRVDNLSLDTINLSREVNIFELSINPLSQFTAVLASASAKNSVHGDDQASVSGKHKAVRSSQRQNNNDEFISSMSSSSSITSPSSCSMSSSPLTLNLKNLKANSNTIHEGQSKLDFIKQTQQQQQQSTDEYKSPERQPPKKKSRNLSSNSNGENCAAQELPLIGSEMKPNHSKSTRMQDNFGYSLLASYCDQFVFEFVLHGTSDRSFLEELHERLVFSKRNSIIDCPIEEAVYIVVDLDELDVKVYSSETPVPETCDKSIPLIDSMLSSVLNMVKLFKSSEFVLLHMEDKLQELYNKALALNQLKSQSNFIDNDLLIHFMELADASDLEFLNRILQAVDVPNLF